MTTSWMASRPRQAGETRYMVVLAAVLQEQLQHCTACTAAYNRTGMVPLSCDECGAGRDQVWFATAESIARSRMNGGSK